MPFHGNKSYLEERIKKFYLEDEFYEQYEIEVDEMILLQSTEIEESFSLLEEIKYQVLYCHISTKDGRSVYLLIMPMKTEECWKHLIEKYEISCDFLIDSHKGLGGWFENTKLYHILKTTERKELLPKYYFKGLYISNPAPKDFKLVYRIPEVIYFNKRNREIDSWQKEIYRTEWRKL